MKLGTPKLVQGDGHMTRLKLPGQRLGASKKQDHRCLQARSDDDAWRERKIKNERNSNEMVSGMPETSSAQGEKKEQSGWYMMHRHAFEDVVNSAPRIRVRRATDRARDQLADLAVLNERLRHLNDAEEAVKARSRVEFLKRRRRIWSKVYEYVMSNDVECTLSAIEDANKKVERMLSEEVRERSSVKELKTQLQSLQGEVDDAHKRLQATQEELEKNLMKLQDVKDNADQLERTVGGAKDRDGIDGRQPVSGQNGRIRRDNGLYSSLELGEELKNQYVFVVSVRDFVFAMVSFVFVLGFGME